MRYHFFRPFVFGFNTHTWQVFVSQDEANPHQLGVCILIISFGILLHGDRQWSRQLFFIKKASRLFPAYSHPFIIGACAMTNCSILPQMFYCPTFTVMGYEFINKGKLIKRRYREGLSVQ